MKRATRCRTKTALRPRLSENQVRFWLTRLRKLDARVKSHRETLINTFVNAVYLYDEKVLIAFNYKDGTKTITFDEIAAKDAPEGNGSDLVNFAPPRERLCRNTRAFFFCTNSKLTQAGGFEQGGGAKHRKQSAQCNNDDHCLRQKQGGVVGAAF